MSIEKEHAEAWRRYIVDAGASEDVAQQAVALAALNGLFDLHRIVSLPWHPSAQEWRDISTAPKDQEVEVRGIWKLAGDGVQFTHWRPVAVIAEERGTKS